MGRIWKGATVAQKRKQLCMCLGETVRTSAMIAVDPAVWNPAPTDSQVYGVTSRWT